MGKRGTDSHFWIYLHAFTVLRERRADRRCSSVEEHRTPYLKVTDYISAGRKLYFHPLPFIHIYNKIIQFLILPLWLLSVSFHYYNMYVHIEKRTYCARISAPQQLSSSISSVFSCVIADHVVFLRPEQCGRWNCEIAFLVGYTALLIGLLRVLVMMLNITAWLQKALVLLCFICSLST